MPGESTHRYPAWDCLPLAVAGRIEHVVLSGLGGAIEYSELVVSE
jgi:hypothetical protein